jgi:hypothetical protein
LWPTPQQGGGEWTGCTEWKDRFRGNPLMNAVKLTDKFPTPHSNCHTGAGKRGDGGENLQTAVMWPTPTVQDSKGKEKSPSQKHKINELAIKVYQETNAVMNYPSPRTRGLCGGSGHKQMLVDKFGEEEGREIFNGGQLNPTWVDWLMGYPIGWTDFADSETRLSLK